MRKLAILFAAFPALLIAQKPTFEYETYADQIFELDEIEVMRNYIDTNDLKGHLKFLASDELEGRETGTRGQKVAAKYIATQFEKMGLSPVVPTENGNSYLQTYALEKYQVNSASINFSGKSKYTLFDDFLVFSQNHLLNPLNLSIVYTGYGIRDQAYNNLQNLGLKGKAALCLPGEPMKNDSTYLLTGTQESSIWSDGWEQKAKIAEEAGALALLVIFPQNAFDRIKKNPQLTYMLKSARLQLAYKNTAEGIPIFILSEEMGNALFKRGKTSFEKERKILNKTAKPKTIQFKKEQLNFNSDVTKEDYTAENVIGYWPGTSQKNQTIVISAHYDHLGKRGNDIYNGADDDGSGTSCLLELADAFTSFDIKPEKSILFIAFSGEEKGLLGSEYYSDHPLLPLENTVADLNIDMVGRIDEKHAAAGTKDYVYIIGSDKLSSQLHKINEAQNKTYTQLEFDYTYNSPDDPNQFYYRSDHYNFAKHDIPVIFYFTGVHEDYHKPTDTVDKIMFGKTKKICELVLATAWKISSFPGKLPLDQENDFENNR